MIIYSIIELNQLEGATRFDAEYYQPEYFIDFSKGKWVPIGDISEICQYGISQAMNKEDKGYPIFRMDDIKDSFLVNEEIKYVDITDAIFQQYKLLVNDILFNRVNSEEFVGRTGIFKLVGDFVFASYLIRLRIHEKSELLPDYLNIFLNSSYGIKQIRKFRRRAVNQANVNAEELKKIKIAILPMSIQKEIDNLSNSAWEQLGYSKSLHQQAENLLLEELGLKDFQIDDSFFYSVDLSDINFNHRFDADYFQPKYEKLISKLKSQSAKPLLEVVENVSARFNPKPDENYHYIELSNINSSIGIIDGFSEISGKETPSRARRLLKAGDVIVSSVEGSLDKVALVDKENEDSLASTGFFQFQSKTILPEVLLLISKSIIMQMQLQKQTAGTILTAVPNDALKNILIPLLPDSSQQKIADLVRKSHDSRKKSKELLETAKRKVEEMIEKDGR